MNEPIDSIDRHILKALLTKGRSTFAELAAQVGLTAPTVHDRVKKLERGGVIQGYSASVDPGLLGFDLKALISITTSPEISSREYLNLLSDIAEVQECYSVAGEETYVARIITQNSQTLEKLLLQIRALRGTVATKATVILSVPISRQSLPLEEPEPERPEREVERAPEATQIFARSSGGR
jgi:Lrp/AsnC family leucine-responsive transcriptional regulator